MPAGFNPANRKGINSYVTAHQLAALLVVGAVLFLICVERGFRGLKIDIS